VSLEPYLIPTLLPRTVIDVSGVFCAYSFDFVVFSLGLLPALFA